MDVVVVKLSLSAEQKAAGGTPVCEARLLTHQSICQIKSNGYKAGQAILLLLLSVVQEPV